MGEGGWIEKDGNSDIGTSITSTSRELHNDKNNLSNKTELPDPQVWGLDSVFWIEVKLFIGDIVRSVTKHSTITDVYFYRNHPIRNVEILGVIVGVESTGNYVGYSIDDGSGVIVCLYWFNQAEKFAFHKDFHEIGDIVRVIGKLGEWRDAKRIHIQSIVKQNDPNIEYLHWLEIMHLKQYVYDRQFVVPPKVLGMRHLTNLRRGEADEEVVYKKGELFEKQWKEIADKEEAPSAESLRTLIQTYLQSYELTSISFTDLCKIPKLEEYALKVVVHDEGTEMDVDNDNDNEYEVDYGKKRKRMVAALWRDCVEKLVLAGFMFKSDYVQNVYTLITHEANLGAILLAIIKHETPRLMAEIRVAHPSSKKSSMSSVKKDDDVYGMESEASMGITVDFLTACIRSQKGLQYVCREQVFQSIKRLVADSEIYEVGKNEYRAFD